MSNDKRIDSFDDLFEPFELEGGPPIEEAGPAPVYQAPVETEPVPTVDCPSCGTANPSFNRHCEACGARLSQAPLPMAPPPMVRVTPGSRALGVLAAVVLVAALGAFIFNMVRGGDEEAAPNETSSTTTTTVAAVVEELRPTSVTASSELDRFEAENLIDGDEATYWNDKGLRGQDASLRFRFAQPVQISEIELANLVDATKFRLNYRIKGYQIIVDDLAIEISGTLEDIQDPQRIQIASVATTELTINVTSTYPAQAVGDRPPFNELALQAVRFYGTTRSE